tara:strand:+ start:4643 stop:5245 length:603 start_codon:yes stop_codon:yes gene_type:complete
MMEELKTEKCRRCKILRKPSDFLFNEKMYKTCGVCRENNQKYRKKYYEKNKEKLLESTMNWRINNPEKWKQSQKKTQERKSMNIEKMKIENPLEYKLKWMITHSKNKDEYTGKDDAVNRIDLGYLKKLYQIQDGLCIYCKCLMELDFTQNPKKISLQRINNEYGHIKINCVFSCLTCNVNRQENKYDETHYKDILEKMGS